MIARRFVSWMVLTVLAGCANAQPHDAPTTPQACSFSHEAVRSFLQTALDYYKDVGISVAVYQGDDIVLTETAGFADLEWQRPVTTDARFQIASVGKAFTAALLLRLADQGQVDLDAPVQRYLPEFPWYSPTDTLTIDLLAGHLGGIRHYEADEKDASFLSRHFETARDALQLLGPDPYVARPGTRFLYSSYGYNTLAAVIEVVTGEPFAQVFHDELLAPLRLTDTQIDDVRQVVRKRAHAYTHNYPWFSYTAGDSLLRVPAFDYSYNFGGGNILSTAADLATFGSAFFRPGYLSPRSLARMMEPVTSDSLTSPWGYGWRVQEDDQGHTYLVAEGSNPGYQANLLVFPSERLSIAVLRNSWGLRPDTDTEPPIPVQNYLADRCRASSR